MSETCDFCGGPVNPHDEGSYKQVLGWVHGKKRDSMTLRSDTGKFAHQHCVQKAKAGQAPDQPDLFGEDRIAPATLDGMPEPEDAGYMDFIEELNDEVERATGIKLPPVRDISNHSLGERDDEVF